MLVLAIALLLPQAPATREERVLELVRGLQREGSWHYPEAFFKLAPPPIGARTIVVAEFPYVMCTNSDGGTIDDVRIRSVALDLFAIYGLAATADPLLKEGERSVRIDALDGAAKLGFELRGLGNDTWDPFTEEHSAWLDEDELQWLEEQDYPLFVADVFQFRKLDGDAFSSSLACLAGLVGFLDDRTDGEDVDLGGLLFEREGSWPLLAGPELSLPDGVRRVGQGNECDLVVEQPATVVRHCRGLPDFKERSTSGSFQTMRERAGSDASFRLRLAVPLRS